jgi:XTP/dITP diphosphohydrolase
MSTLVVATGNPGKIAELAQALREFTVDSSQFTVDSSQFTVHGIEALADQAPVEETGATFEANAKLKAEAYSRRTPHLVLADDSGLEVDALDGGPGVLSARYGSPTLSDKARAKAILKALVDVPDDKRTARFRCVLAVAKGGRTLATFDGVVHGVILRELRGDGGFGYDPIFFHPPSGKAFGELTREEKELVSHRGEAIRKFVEAVRRGAFA